LRPSFQRLVARVGAMRATGGLRGAVNRIAGGRPRVVRVLGGAARGARLELDLSSEKRYWMGTYEPEVQELLHGAIRPGDVVYDVGANIGFFTIVAGRLGARVYAFEPAPENAARIARNIELNGLDADVCEAAVWDGEGGVSLVAGDSGSEWETVAGGGVRSVTLDAFARAHVPPDVLKIDVEGAECRVLRGAHEVLRRPPRLVVCEAHGHEAVAEVRALLAGWTIETAGSEFRLVARPRGETRP
jgi:FkbM family methyltransferase